MKGLIDFLDKKSQAKLPNGEGSTLEPCSELENLEKELKAIESQQKAIQEKLSQAKGSGNVPKSSGSNPNVADPGKMSLLDLNSGFQANILHRDFKIQGTIGEVGQPVINVASRNGVGKGYTDKEIVTAIISCSTRFTASKLFGKCR